MIAVGATNPDDTRTKRFVFSNFITDLVVQDLVSEERGSTFGYYIDVVAPGNFVPVMNTQTDLFPYILGGTSFAAPIVAGICTLLLAQDSTRTPAELKHIIRSTAQDSVGDPEEDIPGFDIYHGYGRVNAYNALMFKSNTSKPQPKINKEELTVYPNPASKKIYLEQKNLEPGSTYILYNELGKLILHASVGENTKTDLKIDISGLSSGIYWMQSINILGERLTKKIQVK